RKRRERADVAGELERASEEHVPALVVPHLHGGAAGVPEPAELLLAGDVLVTEGPQRSLQHRHPSRMPLGDQDGQAIQEEIGGARLVWRWRRPCGLGLFPQAVSAGSTVVRDTCVASCGIRLVT